MYVLIYSSCYALELPRCLSCLTSSKDYLAYVIEFSFCNRVYLNIRVTLPDFNLEEKPKGIA